MDVGTKAAREPRGLQEPPAPDEQGCCGVGA